MFDGIDLLAPGSDPVDVRRRIGMVFQRPNPFPDHDVHGERRRGTPSSRGGHSRSELADRAEKRCGTPGLERTQGTGLNKAGSPVASSSACVSPGRWPWSRVLLMDEPASALDPISTQQIEDTCSSSKSSVTIVIVHAQQCSGCPRVRHDRVHACANARPPR